jgi:hypothetical protein
MSKDMTVVEVMRLRRQCEERVQVVLQEFNDSVRGVGVRIKEVRVDPDVVQTIGGNVTVLPRVRVEMELM